MPNNVTPMTALTISAPGPFQGYQIRPYRVNYDQAGQDLQITKASAGQMVYLIGLSLSNTEAFKPIFKSGSNVLVRHELGANSGFSEPYCPNAPRIICNTDLSGVLNFNCDVALPPFIVYVVEA